MLEFCARRLIRAPCIAQDSRRIGTPEAEWHRYILANRCEYAFALYGAVVKFSLFTEIDTYWSVTWLTWLTLS